MLHFITFLVHGEQVGHEDDLVRHTLGLHLHAVGDHGDELAVGAIGELRGGELEIEAGALGLRGGVE